jgi:hypothetical protein
MTSSGSSIRLSTFYNSTACKDSANQQHDLENTVRKIAKKQVYISEYFRSNTEAKNDDNEIAKENVEYQEGAQSKNAAINTSNSSIENDHDYTDRVAAKYKQQTVKPPRRCQSKTVHLNTSNSSLENDHNYAVISQNIDQDSAELDKERQRKANEAVLKHNKKLLDRLLDVEATSIVNGHIERLSTLTNTFHTQLFRKRFFKTDENSSKVKSSHLRKMTKFSQTKNF